MSVNNLMFIVFSSLILSIFERYRKVYDCTSAIKVRTELLRIHSLHVIRRPADKSPPICHAGMHREERSLSNEFRFRDSHVTQIVCGEVRRTKCLVFIFPLSSLQVCLPNPPVYPYIQFQLPLNMTRTWESQAQKGKDILNNSIPKQWLLPVDRLPPVSQKSVVDFPKQSGLLNERELLITEMSATALVTEMGNGKLSAEEVVVAFLKRAVLGHQLVRLGDSAFVAPALTFLLAQFCNRVYGRRGNHSRQRT